VWFGRGTDDILYVSKTQNKKVKRKNCETVSHKSAKDAVNDATTCTTERLQTFGRAARRGVLPQHTRRGRKTREDKESRALDRHLDGRRDHRGRGLGRHRPGAR
jgi:hypothetical protein